jgi:hypothetical protein
MYIEMGNNMDKDLIYGLMNMAIFVGIVGQALSYVS